MILSLLSRETRDARLRFAEGAPLRAADDPGPGDDDELAQDRRPSR
jgi:hypothetical protein